MISFNATELRTLVLAAGLLLLGAAARLGFGPSPDDFSWSVAERPGGAASADLASTRREVARRTAEAEEAARPLAPGERIDVNSASVTQLRRLPGIGPSRAAALAAERASGGAFTGPSDLTRVRGIGPTTARALSAHVSFGPAPRSRAAAPEIGSSGRNASLVDVNRAQIKELEQITGIGPVIAARVVDTRERLGPFRRPEDLLRVPGIGPSVLERIRGQIRF